MLVYKVFKSKEGVRELIGTLPERRIRERVTEESIERYVRSVINFHGVDGEIILEPEGKEF